MSDALGERNNMEDALLHSEEHYRAIISQAVVGIGHADLNGIITSVNARFCEIVGYTREELLGFSMLKITHQEDLARNLKLFEPMIREGVPFQIEKRYVRRDGSPVWVSASVSLIRDAEGNPQSCVAVMTDITERKRAEEAASLQSVLINLSYEPIFVWDVREGIIEWNKGCEQLYGYSKAEAIGQTSHKLLQTLRPTSFDEFLRITEADGEWTGELRHTAKDGREVTVESRQQLIETNGRRMILETNRDITERKRAEEELNASEERLRAIFESSRDGILIEDDERIAYVNQSYTHLFGYEAPEELVGKHVSSVISPEDTERLLEFGKTRMRGELLASVYEFKGKRKDGMLIEIEASVSASSVVGH
ncbi:MAG: PAS domain S-box protein, partial [Acidobacteriota bacterium]|nr:PAS domain S-box protein [Acidobacteriota bacterium]